MRERGDRPPSAGAVALALAIVCAALSLGGCTPSFLLRPDGARPFPDSLEGLLPNAATGIVVGEIENGERTVRVIGKARLNESTLFEFGSVTKVFTAILAQTLADEGAFELRDSVEPYLPPGARGERWKAVTFAGLATHTSGLPRLPPDFVAMNLVLPLWFGDPYARYGQADLYRSVRWTWLRGTGERWGYSNFGYALLGDLLSKVAGRPWERLLAERVLDPLGMATAATVFLSSDIAPPRSSIGLPAGHWSANAMAPAGALKGSVDDALTFLDASMRACERDDPLSVANCRTQQPSGVVVGDGTRQGLGWIRSRRSGREIVWHNGATGGYSAFVGFVPGERRGLVLLANLSAAKLTKPALDHLGGPATAARQRADGRDRGRSEDY